MRNKSFIFSALAAAALLLSACASSVAQLSPRDQLLITCDGLATTMGIVRNFILDGTIDHPGTLARLREASVIVEESCGEKVEFARALERLAAQSVLLLEARIEAETAAGTGS